MLTYKCRSCGLEHKSVEAGGIYYCPNPLCPICGTNWFTQKLDSFKVDEREWLTKGLDYIENEITDIDIFTYALQSIYAEQFKDVLTKDDEVRAQKLVVRGPIKLRKDNRTEVETTIVQVTLPVCITKQYDGPTKSWIAKASVKQMESDLKLAPSESEAEWRAITDLKCRVIAENGSK